MLPLPTTLTSAPLTLLLAAVWCSGNSVGCINEVTLHRARLVLEWVTVFGQVYHFSM